MEVFMEELFVYMLPVLLGVAYFGIITLLKKYTQTTYKHGLNALGIVILCLTLLLIMNSGNWSAIGYGFLLVIVIIILVTYLLGWLIVKLISKRN
jgi:uncharacterized membrane protein YjjP (DUF1212 family)